MLSYLKLNGVGPVEDLLFKPEDRLNIIAGDNGLGKSFLLECAWWALSGKWADLQAYPNEDASISDVNISFQLKDESGRAGKRKEASYDWDEQRWRAPEKNGPSSSLAIYARIDGSFAAWDPVRQRIPPPEGASRQLSPLFFTGAEVWNGIYEKIKGDSDYRWLCNGMFRDWIKWQMSPRNAAFEILKKLLHELSPTRDEPLEPADPMRFSGDARDIPTLKFPYGPVPVVHAAASVRRIVSMAYLIVWAWEEHKIACKNARREPNGAMTVLIDEVDAHLHPRWQRSIISALLGVAEHLDSRMRIQFLLTTHSPLILTSMEPVFDKERDKLFHLDMDNEKDAKPRIVLKETPFLRHGRLDNWITSEVFGLRHARSIEAEKAIEDAKALQVSDAPSAEDVKAVHKRLVRLLSDQDTFWPRWTFFAREKGVDA